MIQLYLQAAKAQAEHCNAPEKGLELYAYAQKLLSRYSRQHCPACTTCR